jgi:uncharacterized protein YggU (UPF0235/DUF167 family)
VDFSKLLTKSTRGPEKRSGWELSVRLTPKASHTKIGEMAQDAQGRVYLKVYVTAVPEDKKANKALIALLSKAFHVPKSNFHIISGLTDRHKIIWFERDIPSVNQNKSVEK